MGFIESKLSLIHAIQTDDCITTRCLADTCPAVPISPSSQLLPWRLAPGASAGQEEEEKDEEEEEEKEEEEEEEEDLADRRGRK